jgi:hypothetical protein
VCIAGNFQTINLSLPLDVVVEADPDKTVSELTELVGASVSAQLQAMKQCLLNHHTRVRN